MSENVLKQRIETRRASENFVDINAIVSSELERRVEEIGKDSACLELVSSGFVGKADPSDTIAALATAVTLIAKKVGLDV